MKKALPFLVALYCCLFSSCVPKGSKFPFQSLKVEANMGDVVRVVYMAQTGTIIPELQWSEEITITTNGTTLTRNSKVPISHINVGSWEIPVDSSEVTDLFKRLKTSDCTRIKRIEADDPPDGGGTESYTVHYQNGTQCALYYDPGIKYEDGDLIRKPIEEFIRSLNIPLMAESRYLER